ncbi:hypothetical protein Pan181_30290 [Aeoliella mucimassa]|uniref:Uncharacterized protein n=1 Tax=Aeoliella mucimassa TaxID=2527972 RepID=A0A518AQ27_9BACT|nr:hypothetical protein Pan181_30290 [Aeoliella mucimassa]
MLDGIRLRKQPPQGVTHVEDTQLRSASTEATALRPQGKDFRKLFASPFEFVQPLFELIHSLG